MEIAEATTGLYVTNGSTVGRILGSIAKDVRWGRPSLNIMYINLHGDVGNNAGYTTTIPDYLLSSWESVPFDWRPVDGGGLEERFVWSRNFAYLVHEYRKVFG